MTCYNSELPIGPPGPTGPQGPQGPPGNATYQVYTALLTQVDDNPPTAIVLENTIDGTISFTYITTGLYEIVNSNGWDFTKIWYTIGALGNVGTNTSNPGRSEIGFEGTSLVVYTFSNELVDTIDYNPLPINGQINNTPIEIRVYN
jgi:hypothetical protein